MASLSDITVKPELRPCLVNGKPALFHKWEQHSEVIAPSIMVGGHAGGEIQLVFGLIEDEKGQIIRVNPTSIQFIDNKIQEYCFEIPAGSSPTYADKAAAKIITSKYTCTDCSDRCDCIVNDSQLDCEYFRERYEWAINILTGGSSPKE